MAAMRAGIILLSVALLMCVSCSVAGAQDVSGRAAIAPVSTGSAALQYDWRASGFEGGVVRTGLESRIGSLTQEPPTSSAWHSALGGLVGGGAGLGVGLAIKHSTKCAGGNACFQALAASLLLEPLGMALGAHWANRSRGSVALDLLASSVVWAAALGLDEALTTRGYGEGSEFVWFLPVQLGVVVLIERMTGRD